jgi:hypothetical protein
MAFKATYTDKDLKKLKDALRAMDKSSIMVGVIDDTKRSDGESNAEIAFRHEVGMGVPRRRFIAPSLNQNSDKYFNRLVSTVNDIIFRGIRNTSHITQALHKVGAEGATDVKKYIDDIRGKVPELSIQTILKKGSDVILKEKGEMWRSITWVVKKK